MCSECYLTPRLKYLVSDTELAGFGVVFIYLELIVLKQFRLEAHTKIVNIPLKPIILN